MIIETILALAIVVGTSFVLIGSIGLVRLGDVYSRLHGPTKATTLGMGALLLASMLHFGETGDLSLHELLVTGFLFLTAPVSAHMLAKAALHLGVPSVTRPPRAEDQDAFPETAPGYSAPSTTGEPDAGR
jgi:multicomponent K+:H+ antiporter subunit G